MGELRLVIDGKSRDVPLQQKGEKKAVTCIARTGRHKRGPGMGLIGLEGGALQCFNMEKYAPKQFNNVSQGFSQPANMDVTACAINDYGTMFAYSLGTWGKEDGQAGPIFVCRADPRHFT